MPELDSRHPPALQYKRTVGGKDVCADGNAEDNFDTPPAGGWGFHDNGMNAVGRFQASACPGVALA